MKRIYSFSCLIISLLILILTIYKSELREEGLMREYYLIYYIISITLLFYSILIIFVNKETFINLSVLLLSLFSILYFFEGYLVFNKFYTENEVNKKKILKFDKRTRYQVYIDLKKKDKNITISLTPGLLKFKEKQIFHLSGISNSKTIDCNESGYYSIYESDRYGFNNPDKEWDQNEVEYLLVGDSFIQGNCVNRPNDISSVLRKLSNKPVVNIAYKAMGPLLEYSSLREYSMVYGINKEVLDSLEKEITIMHPGPINRGIELSSDVADSEHSIILDQVENGVAIRMAVLYLLAGKIKN